MAAAPGDRARLGRETGAHGSRVFAVAVQRAAQAERPHIGPHLLDVGQALLLPAHLAPAAPAERDLAVLGPDRVLLLVVDDHLIAGVFRHHNSGSGSQVPPVAGRFRMMTWMLGW